MIKRIKENHKINKVLKILTLIIQSVLFIILSLTVITFITSKTSILGSIRSMVVLSGSMEPALPVGSIVYITKQIGYDNKDIITYKTERGMNVTHRITGIEFSEEGTVYSTKGDANKSIDSSVIPDEKVMGKVFLTIPYLGKVINFLNSPKGFLAFIITPSVLFISMELWKIKKEIEKDVEKRILTRMQQQAV